MLRLGTVCVLSLFLLHAVPKNKQTYNSSTMSESNAMNIATISAGFEKGDFLVREEQGNRVYFDFFEEVRRRVEILPFLLTTTLYALLTQTFLPF